MSCEGVSDGFFTSLAILFPSLILSIGLVLRDRLRAGAVERALGRALPVRPLHVRLRAVPDHHDPARRADRQSRDLRQHLGDRDRPRDPGDAAADADLPQFLQGHSGRDHQRGDHGFGQLLGDLRRDRAADVRQHHDRRADPDDHQRLERLPHRPDLRRHRLAADDRDPGQHGDHRARRRSTTTSTWRRRC